MASDKSAPLNVGDLVEVTIEKVAHGGHCIARYNGAVIFVRHAIPGENCTVKITSVGSSFNRGDVVKVATPSEYRVQPPCRFSTPGGCGGCDFQHINVSYQRKLKADVITEQFLRIAKMDIQVEVEEVGAATNWRTRAIATTDKNGKLGFYKSRSHSVATVDDCIICVEGMRFSELVQRTFKGDVRVEICASSTGERTISLAPTRGSEKPRITEGNPILHERVGNKTLQVSTESFWQSHISAPTILTQAVLDFANFQEGEHVLDLYGGVGLFSGSIIDRIGSKGHIDLIEGSKSATEDARKNFAVHQNVKVITGDVAKLVNRISSADVVVLDPPREGAGKDVITKIINLNPRAIIYVACDPAALARDTSYLQNHSFTLAGLRAFDLFPMTHHIECVALYERAEVS